MLTEFLIEWMAIGSAYLYDFMSTPIPPTNMHSTAFKAAIGAPLCERRPQSRTITCPTSANASTFLAVDISPTTILETTEDTPEPGAVEESATGILEVGNNAQYVPSISTTLEGVWSKPQALSVNSLPDCEGMSTQGSISDAGTRESVSCPPQQEMLRHREECCSPTRETRQDATDITMPSSSPLEPEWDMAADNETLRHFSYNKLNLILDSMHPSRAPHIVITPAEDTYEDEYALWLNSVGTQWPYYLCAPDSNIQNDLPPLAEPQFCQPLLDIQPNPLPSDATPPVAHQPRRVFNRSKHQQSIYIASPGHLDSSGLAYLQKALCKAAFFAASDVARVLRERYDSQPSIFSDLETPFTWSDPAEPILCASRRMFGATILDSICPFLAPHIIINAPPPQPSDLFKNNATPYTQDALFGDRLVVNAHATEIINPPEGWEYDCYYASSADIEDWDYESSYSSSTVDLLESVAEYSRPGTPLPETPIDSEDDGFEFGSAYKRIYGTDFPVDVGVDSGKPQCTTQPMFYIDEDDDDLPSLDGW